MRAVQIGLHSMIFQIKNCDQWFLIGLTFKGSQLRLLVETRLIGLSCNVLVVLLF
jgi:hypothetical protein